MGRWLLLWRHDHREIVVVIFSVNLHWPSPLRHDTFCIFFAATTLEFGPTKLLSFTMPHMVSFLKNPPPRLRAGVQGCFFYLPNPNMLAFALVLVLVLWCVVCLEKS